MISVRLLAVQIILKVFLGFFRTILAGLLAPQGFSLQLSVPLPAELLGFLFLLISHLLSEEVVHLTLLCVAVFVASL